MWLSGMQAVSAEGSAHSATKKHQLAVQHVMFPCVLLPQGTVSMSGTHKMECRMAQNVHCTSQRTFYVYIYSTVVCKYMSFV